MTGLTQSVFSGEVWRANALQASLLFGQLRRQSRRSWPKKGYRGDGCAAPTPPCAVLGHTADIPTEASDNIRASSLVCGDSHVEFDTVSSSGSDYDRYEVPSK